MMDFTADQREALGRAALDWVLQYFNDASDPPVYPRVTVEQLDRLIAEPLPQEPQPAAAVMAQFAALAALGRKNGHPRMFGYVQSSAGFAGVVGDFLASALNQNVTSWRSAPSATTVERQVVEWLKDLVGFDPAGAGLLLSGGSLANFAALAVALRASTDADINGRGVGALPGRARVYASGMAHMSIAKAASLMGIGRDAMATIPTDREHRMDVAALDRQLAADRAAGFHPVCVVASAGEVNTGAIDPLNEIADVCAGRQVWLHVDGSYGGFAARAPSAATALEGLRRADSLSLDPHKWLFAPLDAGCLLVRNGAHLRRTFVHGAAYVDVIADAGMSEFAFWDFGPELSRRFRALKIWFALKCHGAAALTSAIESNIAVARRLAAAIDGSEDFELLAPVPLSIVCFRYVPAALRTGSKDDEERDRALNAFNRGLLVELQRDGAAYLSNAMIGGVFALRACIVNYRTTVADIDELLSAIRRVAADLSRETS
jgi:glutamate/tyrosine decarboxylase-like PLP-dependent enzyme